MNWLLIIVLVIFLICAVRGWNRGLLRMLYSLVSIVLLIVLMSYATPHISHFIKENTGIHEAIQERCSDMIRERMEDKSEEMLSSASAEDMSLPEKVTSYIISAGENTLEETGVYDAAGSKAADFILAGLSFLIALIAALIIVNVIGRMLDIVNRIPVIKGINRTLGIFAGVFEAFLIIWLLFLFLSLVSGSSLGRLCMGYIDENPLLGYLYYHNTLLEIFSGFFRK